MINESRIFLFRSAALAVLAVMLCEFGIAKEKDGDLEHQVWKLPAALVLGSSAKPEVSAWAGINPSPDSKEWDAAGFVRLLGAKEQEGAEAIYVPEESILIVKNSKENLAILGDALSLVGLDSPAFHLEAEFAIYRYQPAEQSNLSVWPTPAELLENTSAPTERLDRIVGSMKSGQRAGFLRRSGQTASPPAEGSVFAADDFGFFVECESVLGPDETLIDTNFSVEWRGLAAKDHTTQVRSTSAFSAKANQPVVVQVTAAENLPGVYLVVTATFRLEWAVDWSLEAMQKAAKAARALRESR